MENIAEIFDNLKKLQDILVQKYDYEKKVEEAPKQLSTQDEFLARMKKEFIEENNQYEQVKEKVLSLKLDLESAVKAREAGEKGMDNITTHREYEALEKQINEATERENEIRKDLQKEEKNLAELKENLKDSEEMINSQEADLTASKADLDKQINEYKTKLQELKVTEDEISPKLDQEILFKFQRIIQRNSQGIVAVRNGVCEGCHMILPAQFSNIVRKGDSILFCPYCSRILYYEEVDEDQVESFFDIGAAGSLAGLDDDLLGEDEDDYDEDEDRENNEYYDDEDSDSLDDDNDDLDEEDDEVSEED